METRENAIKSLFEKAENFSTTSFELVKLKTVDKAADIASHIATRLISNTVCILFILTLSIGLAFWLGEILGKNYYGFMAVASVGLLVGLIIMATRKQMKTSVSNSIIKKLLN